MVIPISVLVRLPKLSLKVSFLKFDKTQDCRSNHILVLGFVNPFFSTLCKDPFFLRLNPNREYRLDYVLDLSTMDTSVFTSVLVPSRDYVVHVLQCKGLQFLQYPVSILGTLNSLGPLSSNHSLRFFRFNWYEIIDDRY